MSVCPGDRVTVNVETFCGGCFFCKHGYVNNCTDPNGGWALGCRIDGGQAEYVRVPFADQGLNRIPDSVTDEQALFVGDILATGFWAARISEIQPEDTVLIIGAGPTGICTSVSYTHLARRKFLKTPMTEASHVSDLMTRLALSRPDISFQFINNGQERMHTSGNGKLKDVIYHVYGRELSLIHI